MECLPVDAKGLHGIVEVKSLKLIRIEPVAQVLQQTVLQLRRDGFHGKKFSK